LPDLLRRLIDDLAERAHLTGVGIWLYDIAEGSYVLRRATLHATEEASDPWAWRRSRGPQDLLVRALEKRQSLLSIRSEDPAEAEVLALLRGMKLAAVFPVFAAQKLIGFIGFGEKTGREAFHEADEQSLSLLGAKAEHAIGQAHMLYEQSLMLSKLTHDTLNFLHAQGIVLETLQKGYLGPLNEAQESQMGVALHQKDLIQECLIDLRELERLVMLRMQGAWRMRPYDLDRVVAEAVDAFKSRATLQSVSLEREWDEIPRAIGDARTVRRVIDNLIINALKFTPAGGRIRIHITPRGADLELSVTDTGVGIPEDELPRVFDPFYQGPSGQRIAKGTGLGLSVVKEVATLHKGSVQVKSVIGQGTTFIVILPSLDRAQEFTDSPV